MMKFVIGYDGFEELDETLYLLVIICFFDNSLQQRDNVTGFFLLLSSGDIGQLRTHQLQLLGRLHGLYFGKNVAQLGGSHASCFFTNILFQVGK